MINLTCVKVTILNTLWVCRRTPWRECLILYSLQKVSKDFVLNYIDSINSFWILCICNPPNVTSCGCFSADCFDNFEIQPILRLLEFCFLFAGGAADRFRTLVWA